MWAGMVEHSVCMEACLCKHLSSLAHTEIDFTCGTFMCWLLHQEQKNQSANQPDNQPASWTASRTATVTAPTVFSPQGLSPQSVVLVNLGSMFWLSVAMYEDWRLGRFSCHTGAKGLLSSQRGPCGGVRQVSVNVHMHTYVYAGVQEHVWIKVSDYYYAWV